MRIAIIDDEPNLIKLAGHTILDYGKNKGFSITLENFSSGESFLENFNAGLYDIIFMDVYMPGLNGIDTVLKLRESDTAVPVIFLTTSESHMREALSCHAFDYLVKPATRADFFDVLDDCVSFLGKSIVNSSKYIEFRADNSIIKLSSDQIISATSAGHKVTITSNNGINYDAKESYTAIAKMLSDCNNFIQINRGILINMDYIDEMKEGCCYLRNSDSYMIRVRNNKAIYQSYEDYRASKV